VIFRCLNLDLFEAYLFESAFWPVLWFSFEFFRYVQDFDDVLGGYAINRVAQGVVLISTPNYINENEFDL